MLDLIAVGNISADLYFAADTLTTKDSRLFLSQGKYYVDAFYFRVGGSAANVACGIKKNGLRSSPCALVGNNPFRKNILYTLKLKKIPTNLLIFKQNYIDVSVILLKENGERTIINHESEHDHPAEDKLILRKVKKTRAVYLGNLPDVSISERERLLRQLKKRGVLVFGNFGSKDCCRPKKNLDKLLKYIDVLILNTHELSELVKKTYEKINFKKSVLNLLPIMRSKILIVTNGEKGSYGYENEKVYYQKAVRPKKIIDTTGAGDGYTAGFIASYLREENVELSMKKGAQYAAKILGKLGAN